MDLRNVMRIGGFFDVKCFRPNGELRWHEIARNMVVNAGLNHILDVILCGGTQITTWYVGLKSGVAGIAAADTLSSHSGWTKNTNFENASQEANTRPAYVEGAVSSQSVTNSANKALFTITADSQTITGAYLCDHATVNTGILLCVADFGTSKNADTDDTLEVTYTISAADDGV